MRMLNNDRKLYAGDNILNLLDCFRYKKEKKGTVVQPKVASPSNQKKTLPSHLRKQTYDDKYLKAANAYTDANGNGFPAPPQLNLKLR